MYIPIEFITKAPIPEEVIDLIRQQCHSFGQVSILTLKEDLRKILVPRGASTDLLLQNLEKLTQEGIFAVCRIDPIFPYVTDKIKELVELIERIKSHGVSHIVTSILDIPLYKREEKKFYPAVDCTGDCLYCTDPRCGIEDLAMGREGSRKDWRLKDYRRWSKQARRKSSKMLFPDPI